MADESANEAIEFWKRFDSFRKGRTVKDIAEAIGVEYNLVRVQRTRHVLPKLPVAVALAREVGTTVEYLVDGVTSQIRFSNKLYREYLKSSEENRRVINILLGLDTEQTAKTTSA